MHHYETTIPMQSTTDLLTYFQSCIRNKCSSILQLNYTNQHKENAIKKRAGGTLSCTKTLRAHWSKRRDTTDCAAFGPKTAIEFLKGCYYLRSLTMLTLIKPNLGYSLALNLYVSLFLPLFLVGTECIVVCFMLN
jgi:hypothetical protein